MDVLICSGDRDAFQLVSDHVTVLYPKRGVSDLARMTPAAVEEKYGVRPGAVPRPRRDGRRDERQPARAFPGVGPKTAAKWINQFGSSTRSSPGSTRSRGKAGESLREHLADVIRNRRINELVRDLELPVAVDDLRAAAVGPRRGAHDLRRAGVPGAARPAVRDPVGRRAARSPTAPSSTAPGSVPARSPAGWPSTPPATLTGVHVAGQLVQRHRPGQRGRAGRSRAGAAAWIDATDDRAGRRGGARGLAGRPRPAQGAARRQGPDARAGRPRLAAARARRRHRAVGLPLAPGPALLRPGRPDPALPAPRAQGRRGGVRPADASTSTATPPRRRTRCRPRTPWSTWPRRSRPSSSARGGSQLLADVELPLVDVLARMEQAGIAVDMDHLTSLEAQFAGRVKQAADDAYDVIGKQINLGSPKQLQVVLFDELGMPKTKRTKTGYTTDAEALQGLYDKTEHPFLQHLLRAPRRDPAAADRRGPAQDGGRRRPHPHHVQPDDRGDRPAVVDRAQPAEHPDPHRGGPPDPRGVRGRRRAASRC